MTDTDFRHATTDTHLGHATVGTDLRNAPTDTGILYAYAILRRTPEAAEALADLRGVAGERIRLVESPDRTPELAAAVGPVPAADFDEAPLKAHLEDVGWLESTVRAHHVVVAGLAGCGAAVLPLRLATVYRDLDGVRHALESRGDDFLSLLNRVTGRVELGVKIYAVPDPSGYASDAAPKSTGLGAGRAYLALRRRRRLTAEDAWRAAIESAGRLAETAGVLAVDRVAHRPQRGDLAGTAPGPNISNDAYLVPAERVDTFRARVLAEAEELPGVQVEVTGPWAPYSFTLQQETVL